MARISTVSDRDANEEVALTYQYARKGMVELAGREPAADGIEPIEVYAHHPGLLREYVMLEQATAELDSVSLRLKALAQLKAATLTNCEYCIDLGSQISRRWGLTDEEMLGLPFYRSSPLFSDVEKLVLDYAVGVSSTPVSVSDELFDALRHHFDDAQLVELTHTIALENMRGRFNLALGIGAAGFSEGMVCAVPEAAAVTA
jgi:4-carboxymuconolactone decarboxylase